MGMEQGIRTGVGHGGNTCVLQTQFFLSLFMVSKLPSNPVTRQIFTDIVIPLP